MNNNMQCINAVLDCRINGNWFFTYFDEASRKIIDGKEINHEDTDKFRRVIKEKKFVELTNSIQEIVVPYVLLGIVLIDKDYEEPGSRSVLSSYPIPIVRVPPHVALIHSSVLNIGQSLLIDSSSKGKLVLFQIKADESFTTFGENSSLSKVFSMQSSDKHDFDDVLLHRLYSSNTFIEKPDISNGSLNTLRNLEASYLTAIDDYKKIIKSSLKELFDTIISLNYVADINLILCSGLFFEVLLDPLREILRERLIGKDLPIPTEGFMIKKTANVALQIGALNYAQKIICGPGVWATHHTQSRIFNIKTPPENIEYKIIHPTQSVYDLTDNSIIEFTKSKPILVVIDDKVFDLYGQDIFAYLEKKTNLTGHLRIKGEERNKTWIQAQEICKAAIEAGLRRDGIILAIGGGVVLDVVGFAASIFRRGVPYLRIPTTLIGMIDVGVGIKQGINFGKHKNLLGAFYPAIGSINDSLFLKTLDKKEITFGIAEIVKMGIICDEELFKLIEQNGEALVDNKFQQPSEIALEVMLRSEQTMMAELQPNIKEANLQRLVDFGHTFSPTIEAMSDYTIPHGLAVGIDMLYCTFTAVQRRICKREALKRLLDVYNLIGLDFKQTVSSAQDLLSALDTIRAHRGGTLNLVVPKDIGLAEFIQDVSYAEIQQAIAFSNSYRR